MTGSRLKETTLFEAGTNVYVNRKEEQEQFFEQDGDLAQCSDNSGIPIVEEIGSQFRRKPEAYIDSLLLVIFYIKENQENIKMMLTLHLKSSPIK